MKTLIALAAVATLAASPTRAQQENEEMASAAEMTKVNTTLEKLGCKAVEVEKESAELFEVDDAECTIGQYDIKLDKEFNVLSMTKDF